MRDGIGFEGKTTDKICEELPCPLALSERTPGQRCSHYHERPALGRDIDDLEDMRTAGGKIASGCERFFEYLKKRLRYVFPLISFS